MNNKLTFPALASLLADKSGRSKRFSEDFLREFFALVSETLENGDSVKIKGLGTFRLSKVEPRKSVDVTTGMPMEIAGHTKVVFTPAKEMAEAVNVPFEAFSSVEIPEYVDFSSLEDDTLPEIPDAVSAGLQPAAEDSEDPDMVTVSAGLQPAEEIEPNIVSAGLQPAAENTELSRDFQLFDEAPSASNPRRPWFNGFLFGMLAAVAVIAIVAGSLIWFAKPDLSKIFNNETVVAEVADVPTVAEFSVDKDTLPHPQKSQTANTENVVAQDVKDVPTAPSDQPVYDTIGKTRYLTTMAKEHYGNYNLWPYIYEENKAFLRHPDRIKPGTRVVVPQLSKYGVDPENPDDVAKAKRLGVEIYSRYKLD